MIHIIAAVTIAPSSAQTQSALAESAWPVASCAGISVWPFSRKTSASITTVEIARPRYIARITAGCSPSAGSEMRTNGSETSDADDAGGADRERIQEHRASRPER